MVLDLLPFNPPHVGSFEVIPTRGGVAVEFFFPNGYGASVIRSLTSYGGAEGFWELAPMSADGEIVYVAGVSGDPGKVRGWLNEGTVEKLLAHLAGL